MGAASGQVVESKQKLRESEELTQQAKEWVNKAKILPEVCDICGLTKENNHAVGTNKFQHEMGKIHQGFVLMRKWHADLREKVQAQGTTKKDSRDDKQHSNSERARDRSERRGDRQR